jgi:putative CocE/NonD family hydrolase
VLKGDRLKYYREALAHPTFDDWWKQRSLSAADYAAMDLPTLVVTGNFDFSIGAMTLWAGLAANATDRDDRQLLIGPWHHGQSYVGTTGEYGPFDLGEGSLGDPYPIRLAFFDRHLKGKGDGPDLGGKVKAFITGANVYRSFSAYPPKEMRPRELFLSSGGRANSLRGDGTFLDAPRAEAPADTMHADPALPFVPAMTSALNLHLDARELARQSETLVFATAPLERPLTLIGEREVHLHVAADTPDADVSINLCEARPDGMLAILAHHSCVCATAKASIARC